MVKIYLPVTQFH